MERLDTNPQDALFAIAVFVSTNNAFYPDGDRTPTGEFAAVPSKQNLGLHPTRKGDLIFKGTFLKSRLKLFWEQPQQPYRLADLP